MAQWRPSDVDGRCCLLWKIVRGERCPRTAADGRSPPQADQWQADQWRNSALRCPGGTRRPRARLRPVCHRPHSSARQRRPRRSSQCLRPNTAGAGPRSRRQQAEGLGAEQGGYIATERAARRRHEAVLPGTTDSKGVRPYRPCGWRRRQVAARRRTGERCRHHRRALQAGRELVVAQRCQERKVHYCGPSGLHRAMRGSKERVRWARSAWAGGACGDGAVVAGGTRGSLS
jgi:hypothetical protein